MTLPEMFTAVAGLRLSEAAARFAAAGVPVFPCVPGGKRPLVEHGFHDASTDAGQIAAWWGRWPAANIGVPTGTTSGVEVVDVDRKTAGSGFAGFTRARRAGLAGGWVALVRTPSGGMHAYYRADPDRPQPSWQAARARIDFRGDGGYVIVPPSVVVTDGRRASYVLTGGPDRDTRPVDAGALRDFLDPRPPRPVFRPGGVSRAADTARLAGWVAALGEGERNRGLFWAACRLAEAGAPPASALDVLGPAGERAGLPPREVFVTIRSAYRTIHATPKSASAGGGGHDEIPRRPVRDRGQVLS
ncbi:Bifunctional DNA primase/polymerase, N-terminal [Brevibacterium sp. Mu109]|uniref:bifunctional DNA primase/polymerase n=1 Tax=Micrococcales TaxID=85006 RepID=UPI000C3C6006|nr:bifunctional DNA primase/polymerase [Brevibacterium sp. Mu109]SMY00442.1 Bifunctional DNA primase/polymerase, N-terminal [Brevibacterium sp. Mu109]